ncbi:MAG: hypothetical protein KIT25_14555 [Enhydrobacter sp.]|nr:MAG: hypothetical protein KIT25_14555 [Enhydrobacter sp.]
MFKTICALMAAGLLAAACSHTETRTVVVPTSDSCSYYGYTPGTEAYRICAEREAAARARGRMAADYAEARIVADAQDACVSYGLIRGSVGYDRCVQREVAARRAV